MDHDRELFDAVCRESFGAFVYSAMKVLYPGEALMPNWHIDYLSWSLENWISRSGRRQLIINVPPRSLKSTIASICLPAWLLGHDPTSRIICASYGQDLAAKFGRDTRALMESPLFRRLFPGTRINRKKSTENEFETTARGFRVATSVGGTLTGKGGTILIIDDPVKANEVNSESARNSANDWMITTALSRLDRLSESAVLVVMQRLHAEDLTGFLQERGNWKTLALPAVSTKPGRYRIGENSTYYRRAGEVLQPKRDKRADFDELVRSRGSHLFAAQYQQDPTPAGGNMIKKEWLKRYNPHPPRSAYRHIVLAMDPAGKAGASNDYSAIAVAGVFDKTLHLLEMHRGHWNVMQMQSMLLEMRQRLSAGTIVIEDTATGMGLIQLLRQNPGLNIIGRHPKDDKVTRVSQCQGQFEAGTIQFPQEAPWLAEFERELLGFPYGKNDDQVDALLLALEWFK
jgi:predicted phage terminase large subunit-like protein